MAWAVAFCGSWLRATGQGGIQNISAIVWFACIAGVSLLFQTQDESAIRPLDIVVSVLFLVVLAAPASELNWIAVTGLSFYVLLFAGDGDNVPCGTVPGSYLSALTVPMLWSRLLFSFLSRFFLEIDASLVGSLLGTDRTGNVDCKFADGSGDMVIPSGMLVNGERVPGVSVLGRSQSVGLATAVSLKT